jgi:hypothetical protein
MDSCGLNSIILTDGSTLDTRYRSGHNINNNYEVRGHCKVTECPQTDINITVFDMNVFNSYRYHNNMKKMSAISKDEPESSLNRAVWWTEYVIRHNGAKHLRSAALDLAWYQYLLLDVMAFLFLIVAIAVLVSYLILKIIYRYLTVRSYKVKSKHD